MKVLIVGCGSIGRRHATNLHAIGVNDLLLFDTDHRRSEALASGLGVKSFNTLESAYKERPDAAMICVPTGLHTQLAREALEQGCHLFIEKPISHSLDGVAEFVNEAEQRRRVLLVGYNFRFDPLADELAKCIRAGRIGHVTSARLHSGCYLPSRHPWEDYRTGYAARQELGGGVILDAVHELDLALWLFGEPDKVYCAGGKLSRLEIDVEDTAEIVLSYRSSVVSIHLDYVQQPAERRGEVTGERGQIKVDLFSRELRYFDGQNRQWHTRGDYCPLEDAYKLEVRHFLDCLQGRSKPRVDGATAIQSLRLAEAAKQSMQFGRPVCMKEFEETRFARFSPAIA
jgi:predicted dehydrogenase